MSFPAYGSYRDSGMKWLGQLPSHWKSGPIRYFARLESGHTPSRQRPEYWENCTIPWFTLADVSQLRSGRTTYVYDTKEAVSEIGLANSSARLLPKGTVMLSRTASVGFSAIMGRDMATTQDFANWVCSADLLPEFLLASLHAMVGEFRRLMMGSTHQTIYMPDIAKLAIGLPPIQEQTAIAAFLDRETGKIDALVEEQTRLIELLKEKRQAVISHAVTKGLTPDVPMKDTGVEWLGEVPAHWNVYSLRRCLLEHRQGYYSSEGYADSGVKLLRITDLQQYGRVEFTECPRIDHNAGIDEFLLKLGDFVFARTGGAGTFGLITELPEPAIYASYLIRFRLNPSAYPRFLAFYFATDGFQKELKKNIHGGVNQNVHAEDIKSQFIALPPIAEQVAVSQFLEAEIAKFDRLVIEAESAIVLLQERRSALISAAVTGKIDVRGLVSAEAEAA